MLAATLIATMLGRPVTWALPARRKLNPMAQLSWDCTPELLALKDILTEANVDVQIELFRELNDEAHIKWLSWTWKSFSTGSVSNSCTLDGAPGTAPDAHAPGQLDKFIDKLMHSGHEYVFVKARSLRQGTPSNPYLKQSDYKGYLINVEPANVAQRLMACREDLAAEWREDLAGLASGCEAERLPHMQRLVRLATGAAFHRMLRDLALVPSQAAAHDYLETFIALHADALGLDGDPYAILDELRQRPLCDSGKSFIDPPQMAAELRWMRQGIATAMADTLACTSEAHRETEARYLEACLRQITRQSE